MQRQQLEGLSREELVERAERLGVPRPRVLTQPELMDEILARSTKSARDRARARGWLGRARDLIAGVIERGLHLPDVAKTLRATPSDKTWPEPPPPLPTITLAEIYAAQGHLERAVAVLDEVLAREPDHAEAGALRKRFADQASRPKSVRPEARRALGAQAAEQGSPPRAASTAATAAAPATAGSSAVESAAAATAAPVDAVAPPSTTADAVAKADSAPPLPERYDVDEVVAIAVDPTTIYVYWEVRPTTMARARARRPEGQLALRVMSVTPSWDGPLAQTRDLRIDPLFGDLFVRELPPGANVRVSVGWRGAARRAAAGHDTVSSAEHPDFEPFAVGLEINAPRSIPTETPARGVAVWSPSGNAVAGGTAASPVSVPARTQAVAARALQRMAVAPRDDVRDPWSPRPVSPSAPLAPERRSWRLARGGGASDLYGEEELGGGRSRRAGLGGASDLGRGGASNLGR